MLEPPGWSQNKNYVTWNGLFNWTMTYRLDSDIQIEYGFVKKRKKKQIPMTFEIHQEMWKHKTSLAAIMVSNCNVQSKRMKYVEELQKYMPIDVYGKCGTKSCQQHWKVNDALCMQMINKTYKFYLSFENSLCKDYVTEKFFKVLPLNVIPVVRGAAPYLKYVPKKWYINTADFPAPRHLAEYLKSVGGSLDHYIKFMNSREQYKMGGYFGVKDVKSWCKLCEKLNDDDEPIKSYANIAEWWGSKDCMDPKDIR